MSEMMPEEKKAKALYWWAKVRQALKDGDLHAASRILEDCWIEEGQDWLIVALKERAGMTARAGCRALNDPTFPDKEQDHE